MPRVPTESYYPTADVGAVQPFRLDTSALSPDAASIPGRQEQQMGQGLQSMGGEVSRIAIDFQDRINQTMVLDASNSARQQKSVLRDDPKEGYLAKMGVAALQPEEGKNLPGVYLDRFKEYTDGLMAGLGNDRQREMLKPHLADIALQIQQETQGHAAAQYKEFRRTALDGQLKLSVDEAARNWQDPIAVQKNLFQAMTAVATAGSDSGMAPAEIEARVKIASSTVHSKVIEAMLQSGDVAAAKAYFDKHKDASYVDSGKQIVPKDTPGARMQDGGMTANDILRSNSHMIDYTDSSLAQQLVAATTKKFTPRLVPSNMDRFESIVRDLESGGQDMGKDGKPLTSSKGALYAMQVMPATAKDPGFGISPAANDSPAEYNRVGRELIGKLVQKYGNVAQALAAYNAGSGTVDKAIADKGEGWVSAMPKETQDYVAKGMQKFTSGQGAPQMPTEQEFVADALEPLGTNSRPSLVQKTRAGAEHQYGIIVKSMKEQGDRANENLMRDIIAKGGDFNQVDPALKMELTRLAPGKYDDAVKFSKVISDQAAGKAVELNPAALNTSIQYPERMGAMSDAEFLKWQTTNFPQSQWAAVAKRRDDYLNGKVDTSAGGINHKALDRVVSERMVGAGVNPKPKSGDLPSLQFVDGIKSYISQGVLDQQAQLGRKMTEDELTKFVDTTFAKDVNFKSGFGWFNASPGSQKLITMKIDDLPNGAKDGIKRALIATGNKNPTETDILQQYRRMHK